MATIVTGLPFSSSAAVRANQWPVEKAVAVTMHVGFAAELRESPALASTVESASMSTADDVRETAETKLIEISPKRPSRQPP
jgi:hypothetical protein